MIYNTILRAYELKKQRNFPLVYIALDVHDTIWPGTRTKDTDSVSQYYPLAKEILQFWTNQADTSFILYTCSTTEQTEKINQRLKQDNILIKQFNENKECHNTSLSSFEKKLYFQILLDDKAGFEPEQEWRFVKSALEKVYDKEVM
jgi:hypothetical protein